MLFMTGSFLSNVSKRAAKSLVPYRFVRGHRWRVGGKPLPVSDVLQIEVIQVLSRRANQEKATPQFRAAVASRDIAFRDRQLI